MCLDDAIDHGEAHADSLTCLLCREEGLEDAAQVLSGDANTRV